MLFLIFSESFFPHLRSDSRFNELPHRGGQGRESVLDEHATLPRIIGILVCSGSHRDVHRVVATGEHAVFRQHHGGIISYLPVEVKRFLMKVFDLQQLAAFAVNLDRDHLDPLKLFCVLFEPTEPARTVCDGDGFLVHATHHNSPFG